MKSSSLPAGAKTTKDKTTSKPRKLPRRNTRTDQVMGPSDDLGNNKGKSLGGTEKNAYGTVDSTKVVNAVQPESSGSAKMGDGKKKMLSKFQLMCPRWSAVLFSRRR
jgi:hypothetical protein